jgi:GntR family transcriptional regulator, galactonate operon transcriptional repressor
MSPEDLSPSKGRPRVHKHVLRTLAQRILTGEVAPGQTFLPESELCETLGIGRSSLREVMKVLEGKGLISSRPRAGTFVQPRDQWNILDPELLNWSMELPPDPHFVMSLIEARQAIEPASARLAAMRASAADLAPVEAAYAVMCARLKEKDFAAFNMADIEFHTALLRASKNAVFVQMSRTIGAALGYAFRMTIARSQEPGKSLAMHGEVIDAILARDPQLAHEAMTRLLNIAVLDLGLSG